MLDVIQKLLVLQDRDQRLRAFQTELAHVPEERKAREKLIADSAARLEQAKTRAKEIEAAKKNLELEVKGKQDSINRYRQQQLQTRKNEEYSALAHEIEAAEKAISALEDSELELMEELDGLKPAIEAAEKTHAEEKAKIEQVLATLEGKVGSLKQRVAEIEKERSALTPDIDEDVLERYQKLFKTKNASAVVALEHETCTGCHMKVTTQTVVQVKAQKEIVHCPQCGRVLYLAA